MSTGFSEKQNSEKVCEAHVFLLEKVLLVGMWIICFLSIWFIPKDKLDKASFVFLITQFFTWISGLLVVQFGGLEYPVRELWKANATSFSFEYFVLPMILIFFVLYYPNHKPLKRKILYYIAFSSTLTIVEYLVEKYTFLIKYHSWDWYWSWISVTILFYIVMSIYKWFFKMGRILSI